MYFYIMSVKDGNDPKSTPGRKMADEMIETNV